MVYFKRKDLFIYYFFSPHSTSISFVTKPVRALQRAAGEEQFCQVTAALQPYDVDTIQSSEICDFLFLFFFF